MGPQILAWVIANAPEILATMHTWAPIISEAVQVGKPVLETIEREAPGLIPKIEAAVRGIIPNFDQQSEDDRAHALEMGAKSLFAPKTWTQDDDDRYFGNFGAGSQS